MQRPRSAVFPGSAEEQRVPVPYAAEAREADPHVIHDGHSAYDVYEIDDRQEPPEQHLQRDELAPPEEAEVPPGQGEEGQHHPGHHNERLHRLLAAVLRARPGQAVPQGSGGDPSVPVEPVPLAGLLQQPPEPHHLRHPQQRLQEAVPRDPLLPLQQPEPHDEGGVLPEPVRRPHQQLRDQGGRDGRRGAPRPPRRRVHRRRGQRPQRELPVIQKKLALRSQELGVPPELDSPLTDVLWKTPVTVIDRRHQGREAGPLCRRKIIVLEFHRLRGSVTQHPDRCWKDQGPQR